MGASLKNKLSRLLALDIGIEVVAWEGLERQRNPRLIYLNVNQTLAVLKISRFLCFDQTNARLRLFEGSNAQAVGFVVGELARTNVPALKKTGWFRDFLKGLKNGVG